MAVFLSFLTFMAGEIQQAANFIDTKLITPFGPVHKNRAESSLQELQPMLFIAANNMYINCRQGNLLSDNVLRRNSFRPTTIIHDTRLPIKLPPVTDLQGAFICRFKGQ